MTDLLNSPSWVDDAALRHAAYYQEILERLDQLLERGGNSSSVAVNRFFEEWPNIAVAQRWAAQHASENPHAARLCAVFPIAGKYLLDLLLEPLERVQWLEAALSAWRFMPLAIDEAALIGNLAYALYDAGRMEQALKYAERYVDLAHHRKDHLTEAKALGILGMLLRTMGKLPKARTIHLQELRLGRSTGDQRTESSALGNLGIICRLQGKVRRAIKLHGAQLTHCRAAGDRVNEGSALGNLGHCYRLLGDNVRSIDLLKQRLSIARELGDRRGEAIASWHLGIAYEANGDLQSAVELLDRAVAWEQAIGRSDAENDAAYVAKLRSRIKKKNESFSH